MEGFFVLRTTEDPSCCAVCDEGIEGAPGEVDEQVLQLF